MLEIVYKVYKYDGIDNNKIVGKSNTRSTILNKTRICAIIPASNF